MLSIHYYNYPCPFFDEADLFNVAVTPYIGHGVVMDEFGTNVTNNGAAVNFGQTLNTSFSYMQDLTSDLHGSGVGAVHWPGLRGGDPYSVWKLSSDPQWWLDGVDPLTLNGDGSILPLLQRAWA